MKVHLNLAASAASDKEKLQFQMKKQKEYLLDTVLFDQVGAMQ
jgi:hypothetical protein